MKSSPAQGTGTVLHAGTPLCADPGDLDLECTGVSMVCGDVHFEFSFRSRKEQLGEA